MSQTEGGERPGSTIEREQSMIAPLICEQSAAAA